MEHLRLVILILIQFVIIFKIKANIIKQKHLSKNTLNYSNYMTFHLSIHIYLKKNLIVYADSVATFVAYLLVLINPRVKTRGYTLALLRSSRVWHFCEKRNI